MRELFFLFGKFLFFFFNIDFRIYLWPIPLRDHQRHILCALLFAHTNTTASTGTHTHTIKPCLLCNVRTIVCQAKLLLLSLAKILIVNECLTYQNRFCTINVWCATPFDMPITDTFVYFILWCRFAHFYHFVQFRKLYVKYYRPNMCSTVDHGRLYFTLCRIIKSSAGMLCCACNQAHTVQWMEKESETEASFPVCGNWVNVGH